MRAQYFCGWSPGRYLMRKRPILWTTIRNIYWLRKKKTRQEDTLRTLTDFFAQQCSRGFTSRSQRAIQSYSAWYVREHTSFRFLSHLLVTRPSKENNTLSSINHVFKEILNHSLLKIRWLIRWLKVWFNEIKKRRPILTWKLLAWRTMSQ